MVKLDHLTLAVSDYLAARDWYVNQLALVLEFEIPERGVAALQDSDGFTLFLEQAATGIACSIFKSTAWMEFISGLRSGGLLSLASGRTVLGIWCGTD